MPRKTSRSIGWQQCLYCFCLPGRGQHDWQLRQGILPHRPSNTQAICCLEGRCWSRPFFRERSLLQMPWMGLQQDQLSTGIERHKNYLSNLDIKQGPSPGYLWYPFHNSETVFNGQNNIVPLKIIFNLATSFSWMLVSRNPIGNHHTTLMPRIGFET